MNGKEYREVNKEIDECCEGKMKCMDSVSVEVIAATRRELAELHPAYDPSTKLLRSHWNAPLLLTAGPEPRALSVGF